VESEPRLGDCAAVEPGHTPVMLERAVAMLNVRPGLTYIDATAGGGGHLGAIYQLTAGHGDLIAFDQDPNALENLRVKFADTNIKFVHANFSRMTEKLAELGVNTVTGGIIADLGVSSMQLDDPARGFSFTKPGPLDMRMDTSQTVTAADLVNDLSQEQLADIIFQHGEERLSRPIARRIVAARPITTTAQLAEIVAAAYGRKSRQRGNKSGIKQRSVNIHPATRTFQALRIAVNYELESLNQLLEQAAVVLAPGARLVIITFHSLEDRLVKQFFRRMASNCICPPKQPVCTCGKRSEFLIIGRKPFIAEEKEVLANIRSRSAKLRAGEKLS
jgi:16S rRNA (cytosine1402-N4)-methyltransferase